MGSLLSFVPERFHKLFVSNLLQSDDNAKQKKLLLFGFYHEQRHNRTAVESEDLKHTIFEFIGEDNEHKIRTKITQDSRQIIKNHTVYASNVSDAIDLSYCGHGRKCTKCCRPIRSIKHWDFRGPAFFVYLDNNALKKINDNETLFNSKMGALDLTGNPIQEINFANTESIYILALSRASLTGKAIQKATFPSKIGYLLLEGNPIGSLSNVRLDISHLPLGQSAGQVLDLRNCNVSELTNVHICAKIIRLDCNPLRIFNNVTFENVQSITMEGCGITFDIFLQMRQQIKFVHGAGSNKSNFVYFRLVNNAIDCEEDRLVSASPASGDWNNVYLSFQK